MNQIWCKIAIAEKVLIINRSEFHREPHCYVLNDCIISVHKKINNPWIDKKQTTPTSYKNAI
jgi:hypothetical protein